MTTNESRPERRREPRICPKGTVLVRVDTYLIPGRIANLSRSGLRAITPITTPERLLGARVEVSFRLDGAGASWLELRGRLMRIGAGSLALALDIVPLDQFYQTYEVVLLRVCEHNEVDVALPERQVAADAPGERGDAGPAVDESRMPGGRADEHRIALADVEHPYVQPAVGLLGHGERER